MKTTSLAHLSVVALAFCVLSACQKPVAPDATGTDVPAPQAEVDRAAERAAREAAYEDALPKAKASRGQGSPALWSLSDEDTTLYIMGTVHLLKPDLEWQSEAIADAFESADTLVFETDTTSPEAGRAIMQFVSQKGLFQNGEQLTNMLTPVERAEVEKATRSVGLPIEALQSMRPWFATVNLQNQKLVQDGFDPNAGVEMVLEAEARETGKSFAYLETIDEQLGLFAGLADDDQVEFLVSTAEEIDDGTDVLDILVDEWLDGDIEGLGVLAADPEMWGSQPIYDALLASRNARWVPQIEAMLDEPGTKLIAVGAAHLAGEDSVITLLRGEGYEVTGP